MERPFDYPGSISDDYLDSKYLVVLSTGTDEHGDTGEYYTTRKVCAVPPHWTDDFITETVQERWPHERCQHSYDCCGRYYPSTATWLDLKETRDGSKLILVTQQYSQNI